MPRDEPSGARDILELLDGFRASKALFTAVSLRIFDVLHEAPASLDELCARLECERSALERLLGVCCSWEFLSRVDGRFANTETATHYLRAASPETLTGYIDYSDRVLYRLWGRLGEALHEGTNRWPAEFGSREELFEHFFADEGTKSTFLAGMHGLGLLSSPEVAAAFDLSGFSRMADVGGGTGHLVIEVCRRYPAMRGILYDLPGVTPFAARHIGAADLTDRIEMIAGDFFRDELPEADLYGFCRILHDWTDEKIAVLLRKAWERLPTGGGVLICETILSDDKDGPASSLLQSLNMLVVTEGRERTAAEYEALTRAAGFQTFEARRTGRPLDAMLALK